MLRGQYETCLLPKASLVLAPEHRNENPTPLYLKKNLSYSGKIPYWLCFDCNLSVFYRGGFCHFANFGVQKYQTICSIKLGKISFFKMGVCCREHMLKHSVIKSLKCLKKYVYQYFLSAASMTPNNDYRGGNYHPPHSTLDFQVQDQNNFEAEPHFTSPPPHDEGYMIVCCPRSLKSLCYSYAYPFVVVLMIILGAGFVIWFFLGIKNRLFPHRS